MAVGNFPGPMMTVSAVQRQTELSVSPVLCCPLTWHLHTSSVRPDSGHSSSSVLETAGGAAVLCCAGVICSSFKCSDGTQHLAALLRGRVVFIQDRDTEAHCDLEHGDMERCNVQQSQYLQYLHNIYTVSTHSPSQRPSGPGLHRLHGFNQLHRHINLPPVMSASGCTEPVAR